MPPEAWAHSPAEPASAQGHDLVAHLRAVADYSARFAERFGPTWGELAGLWHDLGKFRPGFQRYIRQDKNGHIEGRARLAGNDKTHSAAGALHALDTIGRRFGRGAEIPARVLAYVIAGHHAGLADWHDGLNPRLLGGDAANAQRELTEAVEACRLAAPELLPLRPGFDLREALREIPGIGKLQQEHEPLVLSLWIRMLFSALVDADFLDTEAYYEQRRPLQRAGFPPLTAYLRRLDEHLEALTSRIEAEGRATDAVMRSRAAVLAACRAKAQLAPGVFSLAVPTGGGKTLASMAFALTHAQAHDLRRVVVAIPYTSIVEQTADAFSSIFGRDNVVEHHSQADADDSRETARSRLACENWDAPLIVTTNVQLLESLFAARTSRCRKLHRLAGSVIVLDEAQLLPPPFLQPVLDALRVLVRFYGVTLVLCTATQPVLTDTARFDPRQRLRGLPSPVPIIDEPATLYTALERVRFEWPADWQTVIEVPALAHLLTEHECVLAIVNTRKDAADLVAALDAAAGDGEPTLHLSAAMCGQHRADVIAMVRSRLARRCQGRDTRPLRVVSTQIVEAGVDIDFPVVFRALAGLDSIAQAAGRCNREGSLGERGGRVVVFVRPIPGVLAALRHGAQATVSALAGAAPQSLLPQDFERYFRLFYAAFDSRDQHGIVDLLSRDARDFAFAFGTAASKFRLVDDEDQVSVVVPYVPAGLDASPVEAVIAALDNGKVDHWRLRALQRFIVNARARDAQGWQARGDVREVMPNLYLLTDSLRYDKSLGLLAGGAPLPAASLVQ